MSRKDYVAIAKILRDVRTAEAVTDNADPITRCSWRVCVDLVEDRLMTLMAGDNPAFDRKRFLAASGGVQ